MKNHFKIGLVTALLNILVITILNISGFLDGDNSNYLIFSSTSLFLLVGIFKPTLICWLQKLQKLLKR